MTAANSAPPAGARRPLENRVPPPLVVIAIGAAMGALARFAPTFPAEGSGRIAAVGLAFAGLGAATFARAETTIDPVNIGRASARVTGGVFGYSRNPMYVGFALVLLGWAVAPASPLALLGPVAFALFIGRFQIAPEERAMAARFGAEYTEYRAGVRRWM